MPTTRARANTTRDMVRSSGRILLKDLKIISIMTAVNKRKLKLAAAPELVTPLFVVLCL